MNNKILSFITLIIAFITAISNYSIAAEKASNRNSAQVSANSSQTYAKETNLIYSYDYSIDNEGPEQCVDFDDPYEKFNRKMFMINSTLDYFFLRPVARTYRTFVPAVTL